MQGTIAIVALGANLGDRAGNLRAALSRLAAVGIELLGVSSFHETVPVGYADQPDFINAVAAMRVPENVPARDFLKLLLETEHALGRARSFPNAPRTCDLDLIFFGSEQADTSELTLPHPRWQERAFVREPLIELLEKPCQWNAEPFWQNLLKTAKKEQ